ncbi:MAG: hypothetical protein IPK18_00445 [Sphingobacteriales bacterium]|nr:MAG: hypothetical protein IPK18_00445 [Sphingobacteriales bacterium]
MKKKVLIALVIVALLPLAKKAGEVLNNNKTIVVDYLVDENGKANVLYIENSVSPRKLEKIINEIEETTYMTTQLINTVISVKVKI